jgi:hypothetical protein
MQLSKTNIKQHVAPHVVYQWNNGVQCKIEEYLSEMFMSFGVQLLTISRYFISRSFTLIHSFQSDWDDGKSFELTLKSLIIKADHLQLSKKETENSP